MEFNYYQTEAIKTASFQLKNVPDDPFAKQAAFFIDLFYTGLGLAGESGEFCNKMKKIIRDDAKTLTPEKKEALIAELGDVLWYLSACSFLLGVDLEAVAALNLAKIYDRQRRNMVSGEGDNR